MGGMLKEEIETGFINEDWNPRKSSVDNVFVLRHLIETTQGMETSKGKLLYCCFVDKGVW